MLKVAIIGDFNPDSETHRATDLAFNLARDEHGIPVVGLWIPTPQIRIAEILGFDAVVVGTGVYEDRAKVMEAIRVARVAKIPTLAACGGFQHMILEFARNVLGISGAGHAEFDPEARETLIVPLQCSLRGRTESVSVAPDSQVGKCYGMNATTEAFYCSFGVHPAYIDALRKAGLRIVGSDQEGVVRITEFPGHPYFLGTLFVPQAWALNGKCHPLILGLLGAAAARQAGSSDHAVVLSALD